MTAQGRQALGYGLLAGAGGVTLLLLAWLAVSGVQAGGFVLGLLLLFVLAAPLAGAGWYVLVRGRADTAEERAFVDKHRIVEADRLFRAEVSAQLRQLARIPGLPSAPLQHIAESVGRAPRDESAWYDAIRLDDAQTAVLEQYDDLAWERVRWLRDHASEPPATLTAVVKELQAALDQRSDLLLRGRRAPTLPAAALLQAPSPFNGPSGLAALGLGDAVTRDGTDYVVEALATSFANGQIWKLAHLVPSGAGGSDAWLSVSPGALELAWMEASSSAAPAPGATHMTVDTNTLPLLDTRSSIVQVATASGSAPGVLVRTSSYATGPLRGLVEQWPDGVVRAYAGRLVADSDLEVWPAQLRAR